MAGKNASQLPALAYGSISLANDLLTVYDASDGTDFDKTVAVVEFAKRSLDSADISWMTALGLSSVVPADDKFLIWDASATAWKTMTASELMNKIRPYATINITSTPRTVTAGETGTRFSNFGATAIMVFNLPTGATGLAYSFSRRPDYAMRLDPSGSEVIVGGGAGKYLEILSAGQVDIEWVNGAWLVVADSAVYDFES